MGLKVIVFVILTARCFEHISAQQNYLAAVLEYAPHVDPSLSDYHNVLRNVEEYTSFMNLAHRQRTDIIVFPEYGLTSLSLPSNLENVSVEIPNPVLRVAPCDYSNYSKILIDLSCAAREYNIYTVVNLIEKEVDNTTESENVTYYNTNIVFDRTGSIISRYRKINLFLESDLQPGNEFVTFSTDFNVTFAMFICFDILFKSPALDVLQLANVTDVIYSTAWFSETPFLQALSIQDGYAKANGINLLASGYSNATGRNGGSGIYLADSTIAEVSISPFNARNLLIQKVPRISARNPQNVCDNNVHAHERKIEQPAEEQDDANVTNTEAEGRISGQVPDISNFITATEDMTSHIFKNLPLGVTNITETVCSEGEEICCTFSIGFTTPLGERSTVYKLAAFQGVRLFGDVNAGVRACGIVACLSDDTATCGSRSGANRTNVVFDSITVSGQIPYSADTYDQPSTLTYDLVPVKNYAFCRNIENDVLGFTMTTNLPESNLFTFGIFGRLYNLDARAGSASTSQLSIVTIFTLLVTYVLVN